MVNTAVIFMTLYLAVESEIWHQKHRQQKNTIDKLNFIKFKNFCASKDTIRRVKRQSTKWGEIICKLYIWEEINIKNIQGNPTTQQQKRKQPNSNRDKGGFPGGAVVESLPANAGDTGSSPGLGRSHMLRSNWAHEPQLLSLRVWSLCSATREATIVRGPRTAMKSGPRSPQLEKALTQTQHSQK